MTSSTKVMEEIKRNRDELKLKAHLFKSEVKDKWEDVENKWEHLSSEVRPALKATKEALSEISEANKLLLEEVAEGYRKIKKSLK